ncbi:serine-rich adhesin for platelets-like [Mytilus trossulus]|uniref:serine-rich adhesin for platelets-like n=1 Tax=Mytilus trossulus TaxID=6551 RepID=UPI0030065134
MTANVTLSSSNIAQNNRAAVTLDKGPQGQDNNVLCFPTVTTPTTTNDAANKQTHLQESQNFLIQKTNFGTVSSRLTHEKAQKSVQSAQNKTQHTVEILKKSKTSASDFTPYSLTRTPPPHPFTWTPTPEKKRKRKFTVPVLPTMGPSTKLLNLAPSVRKRHSPLIQASVASICSICTVYPHTISQNSASKVSTASLSTETQSLTHSDAQNSTQSDAQNSTQSDAQNSTQSDAQNPTELDAQNSTQYILFPSKDQNTARKICTVKSPSKTEKIERIYTVLSHARVQKLCSKAKYQITAIKTKKVPKISTVESCAKVQKSDPIICTVYPPSKYTNAAFRVSRNCYSTKPIMSWNTVPIITPVSEKLVQDTSSTSSESSVSTRSESSVPTRSSESITSTRSESTSSIKSETVASTRFESTSSIKSESTASTRSESTESTRIESTASTSSPFPLALFPNLAAAQNRRDGHISNRRTKSFNTASNFARISTVQYRARVQGPKGNHPTISKKIKKSHKISTVKPCAKVKKSDPVIYTVYPHTNYTSSGLKASKNSYITKPTMSWDKVPIVTPVSVELVQDTSSTSSESSASKTSESPASTRFENSASTKCTSITSTRSESTPSIKSESTASTRTDSSESIRIESTESTRSESTESTRSDSTLSTRSESKASTSSESTTPTRSEITESTWIKSTVATRKESTASSSSPFPLAIFPNVATAQNKRDGPISNLRNKSLNTASNFAPYPIITSHNSTSSIPTVISTPGQTKCKNPSSKQKITGNITAAEENLSDDIGAHCFASDDSKIKRLKRKIIEHDWKLSEILHTRNKRRKEALEKCFKKSGEELSDNSIHCTSSLVDAENVSVSAQNQMQTVVSTQKQLETVVSTQKQLKTVMSTQKQLKKVVSAHLISVGDYCVKALTNIIEKEHSESHNTEVKVELLEKEYLQAETCRPEVVIENVEGTDYCQLYNDNNGKSISHTEPCSFNGEHLLVQSKIKEECVFSEIGKYSKEK